MKNTVIFLIIFLNSYFLLAQEIVNLNNNSQISFPNKVVVKKNPNTNDNIYLYSTDNTVLMATSSFVQDKQESDVFTKEARSSLINGILSEMNGSYISENDSIYNGVHCLDFKFKVTSPNSTIQYGNGRYMYNKGNLIILLYLYEYYDYTTLNIFFNSLKFIDNGISSNHISKQGDLKELLNGNFLKYVCDGTGKGRGIKFSINYPSNWSSLEGNRPHIVRKFSNSDKTISAMIIITELEKTPTQKEIEYYYTKQGSMELLPTQATYISNSSTKIEGQPTIINEYTIKTERAENQLKGRMKTYTIFYKKYSIQVQFGVMQLLSSNLDIEKIFNENELLFKAMMNSFILTSKWEK